MKNKNFTKICFIDLETTGIYWNSDVPIQIAAIIVDARGDLIEGYEEKMKVKHKINPEASKVHHIYDKDLINCRPEKVVLDEFMKWLHKWEVDCIITYNGEVFDCPMLNRRCEIYGLPHGKFYFGKEDGHIARFNGHTDCVAHAKRADLFGLKSLGRKWKLTLVADQLGINSQNAHDALADVTILKEVWFKLDPLVHSENWENEQISDEDNDLVSLF